MTIRNYDAHKEKKHTGERLSESKINTYFFLLLIGLI
jgi:hypothetical protein